MKQFHLLISGDVQGVGYRSWFKRTAQSLNITGWVKNRQDGAVEAIIQGAEQDLQKLIQKAKDGPDVGWVETVTVKERPVHAEFTMFEVVY